MIDSSEEDGKKSKCTMQDITGEEENEREEEDCRLLGKSTGREEKSTKVGKNMA